MRDRPVFVFGDCELDLRAFRVTRSGRPVALEPKAVELLVFLLDHAGEVVSKSEILDAVWKDVVVTENAMAHVIAQLRSALGDDAHEPKYIETVHTRGYRFIAPVTRHQAAAGVDAESAPPPGAYAPGAGEPPAASADDRRRDGGRAGRPPVGPHGWPVTLRRVLIPAVVLALAGVVASIFVISRAARTAAPIPGAAGETTPSVAVLPLENLGPSEQQYFADGMTEAITTQLAKIEALKVIAPGAVTQYRKERPPPSRIARDLGVAGIVEGSALLVAGRVRITAHLVDGSSDRQLWAESYEGDLTDVLALQARVARAIAREVRARVTPDEEVRLASTRPVSPAAYAEYLKGLAYVERAGSAGGEFVPSTRAAIERFQAAVGLEPTWGEAHGQLASAYRQLAAMSDSYAERLHSYELARRGAERALELDPTVVSGRLALARLLYVVDGDWEGAEREYREVLRLEPNNADWSYGRFLTYSGRFDEALARQRHAQERWPTNAMLPYDIGCLFVCAGRLDEAEAQLAEFRGRFPGEAEATLLEAMVLSRRGRHAEAADLLEAHREALVVNRATTSLNELSWASARAGQPERARRAVRDLEALGGRVDPSTLYALGDLEGVRRVMEERYRQRDYSLHYARCWPEYDNLMRIPEVARILRESLPPQVW
jgi:TolB-like protein/DNA-binding winged helix-turn-helix (wHTH) protein/Tfp pilus assembly protein PilF